jgi:hypothetical protein
MSGLKGVFALMLLVLALPVINLGMTGCTREGAKVASDSPILVGPPGTRFWTTYSNAVTLSGKPVVFCQTIHCDHQIATGQDSYQNRYMSAEKPGDTVDLQMVAKADDRYETVGGMQILFHKCTAEGAPWVGKSHSSFFLKKDDGKTVQIGEIDSEYRSLEGFRSLMTKGMSDGERWTGDANGSIYRLNDKMEAEKVGEYDRRWVRPAGAKDRLVLPLMMSKTTTQGAGAPWIGELGGVIYVEAVQR